MTRCATYPIHEVYNSSMPGSILINVVPGIIHINDLYSE